MSEYAKYTANTGMTRATTANTGLDGGGTVYTVLTAASNGTFIKTVTIKSMASLCSGDMVRLFISNNDVDDPITKLYDEILIRPAGGGPSSPFAAYALTIPLNFTLKSGYTLLATTNITAKISVIAQGFDITYP